MVVGRSRPSCENEVISALRTTHVRGGGAMEMEGKMMGISEVRGMG